jgi:hypothetical protein
MSVVNRRDFLKTASASAAIAPVDWRGVSIVADPRDPIASSGPAIWAASELRSSLEARGIPVQWRDSIHEDAASDLQILLSGPSSNARRLAGVDVPTSAEGFMLAPASSQSGNLLLAAGRDPLGLVYATLELADRVRFAPVALAALQLRQPEQERSANAIRSMARLFASDVEDKSWYYDRAMWNDYLTMLAAVSLRSSGEAVQGSAEAVRL